MVVTYYDQQLAILRGACLNLLFRLQARKIFDFSPRRVGSTLFDPSDWTFPRESEDFLVQVEKPTSTSNPRWDYTPSSSEFFKS